MTISYLQVGEIAKEGDNLVFYLDHREIRRFKLPGLKMDHPIYFNRKGLTEGGEILIRFRKTYKILFETISGKIRLE